jgi:hypothetical protein
VPALPRRQGPEAKRRASGRSGRRESAFKKGGPVIAPDENRSVLARLSSLRTASGSPGFIPAPFGTKNSPNPIRQCQFRFGAFNSQLCYQKLMQKKMPPLKFQRFIKWMQT